MQHRTLLNCRLVMLLLWTAWVISGLCAAPFSSSDADSLAHWIGEQQYLTPTLPSYGAIRVGVGVAATSAEGVPFARVSPYSANLAVLGLLRAKTSAGTEIASRWIAWYFSHLGNQSGPEGVPWEHFYKLDGSGETTCVRPNDPRLCNYNDATDSAAATFFSVLWSAYQAGLPVSNINTLQRRRSLELLAGVLLKLQQMDGLFWAKTDYHVKYLEDNCEVFGGLRNLAKLEGEALNDPERANRYSKAAEQVQQGILRELYDPQAKLFQVAKFENNRISPADLNRWAPDTQAQIWPLLFGVISSDDPITSAVISGIARRWNGQSRPQWWTEPDLINSKSIEAGHAYGALIAGETNHVRLYLEAVKRLEFGKAEGIPGFQWPFTIADAGWLLQIWTSLHK